MLKALGLYSGAALAEIAGCFAFWAWLRLAKSPWWLAPGLMSLAAFAAFTVDNDPHEERGFGALSVEGLKLAAQSFTKDIAKLSCCAG